MKKWIIRIVLLVILLAIAGAAASYVFVDHELSKMYGGHTEVANIDIPDNTPSRFALTNVNVLAPSAASFRGNQTVVVEDGLIVSIGTAVEISDETPVIDGKDKFLVPGFIDSHVHRKRPPTTPVMRPAPVLRYAPVYFGATAWIRRRISGRVIWLDGAIAG